MDYTDRNWFKPDRKWVKLAKKAIYKQQFTGIAPMIARESFLAQLHK
jgi:hypothetical protein